jgi:hypothetical protein
MRKRVYTTDYEFSRGSKPRGRGGWLFAPIDDKDNEAKWVNKNGTFTDAKRQLPEGEWTVLP